jgi:excisionase family DNA binding protein
MFREPLLTVQEVADRMKVTPRTVGDWIRHDKLRAIKVGRDWRVSVKDLETFANAHANIPNRTGGAAESGSEPRAPGNGASRSDM